MIAKKRLESEVAMKTKKFYDLRNTIIPQCVNNKCHNLVKNRIKQLYTVRNISVLTDRTDKSEENKCF